MPPAQREIPVPVRKLPGAAQTCAFADLDQPVLGAVDPVLLALALAFVLALGLPPAHRCACRAGAAYALASRGPPSRV